MRLFTFNFNRGSGRRSLGAVLGVFGLSFIVVTALGEIFLAHLPANQGWQGSVPEPPVSCPSIVSEAYSDHSDIYDMVYYGLGDLGQNARKADILLLGNSRVLFAFRHQIVRDFTNATGLKVFNLSFLAGDGMTMAMDTIRRQRLAPAVVVVNEDDFFTSKIGPYGEDTISKGRWRAWVSLIENRLSWFARLELHRWFPRFGICGNYSPVPYVFYQCRDDGCLVLNNFPSLRIPFHPGKRITLANPTQEETQMALEFKREMDLRGTKVIFTNIPFGADSPEGAKSSSAGIFHRFRVPDNLKPYHLAIPLAQQLNVPFLAPHLGEITTYDGNHMNPDSADLFAYEFFKEFLKLPFVKSLKVNSSGK